MSAPYRVTLAIQITRRKFVHVITDPEGKDRFLSRSIVQCLDWLGDNDVFMAEVVAGERRWIIELSPLPR